jgi:hypothetical protein
MLEYVGREKYVRQLVCCGLIWATDANAMHARPTYCVESTKIRGGHAAAFSITGRGGRNLGYQRRNVSSNSPFNTWVRT